MAAKETLKVDDYTTPAPFSALPETKITTLMQAMEKNGIRHIPIVENNEPVGIVSDRDLKAISNFKELDCYTAEDIMSPQPFIVSSETPLEEVALSMSRQKFGSALVRDEKDQTLGIFTVTDALNALIEVLREKK